MTDPELRMRPISSRSRRDSSQIIEKNVTSSRGFALLPTMGGQTALNCACRSPAGHPRQIRHRDDRRTAMRSTKREEPAVPQPMERIGRRRRNRGSQTPPLEESYRDNIWPT